MSNLFDRVERSVHSRYGSFAMFLCFVALVCVGMWFRLGVELADDGAFFLRYAQNMQLGQFWVWNVGEAPIWGASAPMYPVVLAFLIKLGVSPAATPAVAGFIIVPAALAFLGVVLSRRFGIAAGIVFISLAALDSGLMYQSASGLETPVTILLLVLASYSLLRAPSNALVGVLAGALVVHKMDLAPFAAFLMLAHWMRTRSFPVKAALIAAAIALTWYVFAMAYFGYPLPNSFMTKSLHQNDLPKIIDWTWFGTRVFGGNHAWAVLLAVLGMFVSARKSPAIYVFLVGGVAVHFVAYTIKAPFEPYDWYTMPSTLALFILAGVGSSGIVSSVSGRLHGRRTTLELAFASALVVLIVATNLHGELSETAGVKRFLSHQEHDRAEAGRWVDRNVPEDFKVLTYWGNPAYYSKRNVVDGSFLNRRFSDGIPTGDAAPEIMIMERSGPGVSPVAPVFDENTSSRYTIVKVFDKTFQAGMNYFFVVLARNDVIGKVTNVDRPVNLMDYVSGVQAGDQFGVIRSVSESELFVHPGATTPTVFDFDVLSYLGSRGATHATVRVGISPNAPPDAIARGGGVVGVSISSGGNVIASGVVSSEDPLSIDVGDGSGHLLVSVDNHGSADTDWVIFSIE